MAKTIDIDRNAVYLLTEAATVCGLTVNAVQAAVKAGELPATKRSRRTFIEGETLWRWITGRPLTEQGANRG
jgi:hypothetical protein